MPEHPTHHPSLHQDPAGRYRNPSGPVRPDPTPFDDLNELLVDLVQQARAVLGEDFVGAYLQGSFAVGDADLHSDCDFLIPVRGAITPAQEAGLRRLHDAVPLRGGHWATEIEGSYPDAAQLRDLRGTGAAWLYVDRGHRAMQWSTHCNTAVVRWSLRERGVTLVGPEPRTLVDEVPADLLRATVRRQLPGFLDGLLGWTSFDIAWAQRYAVSTCARMLHTLDSGEVTSKRAALLWALDALDERWRPLLAQVLADRDLPWDDAPRPGSVAAAVEFARYAEELARARWPAPAGG